MMQNQREKVKDQESRKMYDLVILDINMPCLDGYETCKKICQMFSEAPQIYQ